MKKENKEKIITTLEQYIEKTIRDYTNDLQECNDIGRGHIETQIEKYFFVKEQVAYLKEHYDDEYFNNYFQIESIKNGVKDLCQRICNSLYGFPITKTVAEKENICEDIIVDFCEYSIKPVFGEKVASELQNTMKVERCKDPYIVIDADKLKKSVWHKLAKYYRPHQLNLKTHLEELLYYYYEDYLFN